MKETGMEARFGTLPDLMKEAVWRLDEALASLSPKLRYPWIVSNVRYAIPYFV